MKELVYNIIKSYESNEDVNLDIGADRQKKLAKLLYLMTKRDLPESANLPIFNDPKYDHVILVSGGLDSTIGYFSYLSKKDPKSVLPLYIQMVYNKARTFEMSVLSKYLSNFRKVEPEVQHLPNWAGGNIQAFRNLLFISIASSYVKDGGKIYLSGTIGETPWSGTDKSFLFLLKLENFIKDYTGKSVTLVTMAQRSKREWIKWTVKNFQKLGLANPLDMLLDTFSCYNPTPNGKHCGVCKACFIRWISFEMANYSVGNSFNIDMNRTYAPLIENMDKIRKFYRLIEIKGKLLYFFFRTRQRWK